MHSWSIAFTEDVDKRLRAHLVREDCEEDLIFGLYTPSRGEHRDTALVHTLLYPQPGDRQRHGNVSFNRTYLERACGEALREGCGVALLHSHPHPGWQGMSQDDIRAENITAPTVHATTDFPLAGLTVGSDGTWSGRVWIRDSFGAYDHKWCETVRVIGEQLCVHYADHLLPAPAQSDRLLRTRTVWGKDSHDHLTRLHVGVVGLGSVGSLVVESLARMGMTRITAIDYDIIKPHNLDRVLGATRDDIGKCKVVVAKRQALASATADSLAVKSAPYSIVEPEGYRAALDCDVLISCVDRPRARNILNHFAYAHLIPVIDGGIAVRMRNGEFRGVDWQVQTVGPGRICLECLNQFQASDAQTEAEGMLDDPSYFQGLPDEHPFKQNENVFPFSMNVASLEVLQLIALTTAAGGVKDFGVQRYRFYPGIMEARTERRCRADCPAKAHEARADQDFSLVGHDISAQQVRREISHYP